MTRRGRGATRRGVSAALPDGEYLPTRASREGRAPSTVVAFHGEDGRRKDFDISTLPLPGWHTALTAAFAERVGPSGTIRTVASAQSQWSTLKRFMRFLAALPKPPATASALTVKHLESFREHRMARIGVAAWMEFRVIALLMRNQVVSGLLAVEVHDHLGRRQDQWRLRPKPGYSDRELNALVRAARSDVDAIRKRIQRGWDLVARHRQNPNDVAAQDRILAGQLATIADTDHTTTDARWVPATSAPNPVECAGGSDRRQAITTATRPTNTAAAIASHRESPHSAANPAVSMIITAAIVATPNGPAEPLCITSATRSGGP